MLRARTSIASLILLTFSIAVTSQTAHATSFLWTDASGTDNNWSDSLNWSANGVPGALDTAIFGSGATSGSSTTVNNALTANTTVTTLNYTNTATGNWHVTDIPAGVTLTATNVTMGGVGGASGLITDVAMTDAGTFAVEGSLSIGDLPTANATSVVDFSHLGNFVFNSTSGAITIGPANFSLANVTLAATNTITAATFSDNFNDTSSSSTTTLTLGSQTNNFNVGTVSIAAGRNTTTVSLPSGAGLRVRGVGGTDTSLANMTLGYHNTSGSGSHATATLSLNGGPVDLRFGTLILGRSDHTPTGNSAGQGSISFDTGTVYASNTVMATTVGSVTTGSPAQYDALGSGTITVGANGTLFIGSGGMILVDQTNNFPSIANSTGTLTISSGTVIASNSITKVNTSGTGTVSMSGGTLDMVSGTIGTPAVPVDNFTVSGGALHLNVNGTATAPIIDVTNLSAGSATITIDSVANVSAPVIIHLIGYNQTSSGDQFSGFTLAPLPAGYTGTLLDDSGLIDLSIEPAGVSVAPVVWVGAVGSTLNSSWDLSTLNWHDTNGNASAYNNPDFAHFDDTASNSTVTLTTTNLTPSAFTFTNNGAGGGGLDYTLNGPGAVEGSVGLFKDGSGSVTLAESGGDNFSGGVFVNNGTVILDNAGSAISGGFTINNGATLQIGNNDANGNVPSGTLQDNGTLIIDQSSNESVSNGISGSGSLTKEGSGTLTLTANNGYTGSTTISGGILALSGRGSISNSSSVSVTGATLDLSGVAGVSVLNSLSTANSSLNLAVSNVATPLIVVNGSWSMSGSANTVNVTALPPIASYPTTLTLAQSVNGISGFNMILGSLPIAIPRYAGSVSLSPDNTSVLLTLTAGPVGVRPYVLWAGTNNVSASTNWSDNANWQLPGAPTPADNVLFSQTGSAGGTPFNSVGDGFDGITSSGNVNNFVDMNMTVGTLVYTNVGGSSFSQNTFITNGAALNVLSNGSLTIGGSSSTVDFGAGATEFVTIGGSNGTLNVNNTNGTFFVALGDASSGTEMATLDLSGLGTFDASVSRFFVGVGSGAQGIAIGRMAGTMYLAMTNDITVALAATTNTETSDTANNAATFDIGEADGNAGMSCALYLGQTNGVFADAVGVGREKTHATMSFNPNLLNNNTRPSAYFRGANATAVATWSVGDQVVNSGSGETAIGTADFTGGRVDALVNTVYVGRASGATSGSGNVAGTLTFDNGIINVGTLFDGYQPTNSGKLATGTVNVNTNTTLSTSATLSVSGSLNLGLSTGSAMATGTLNIDGGTVAAGSIACGGTNAITVGASGNGGVLVVTNTLGTSGAPLQSLDLNGNTLVSLPAGNSAPVVITGFTIDGQPTTTNILNVLSAPTVTPPVELPVIQYSTLTINGGTFNLGLGTLPSGYKGYLTNDTTINAIAIVITNAPVSAPSTNAAITKVFLSGTNLIVQGTNNNVPNTNFHYLVLSSTNLAAPLSSWTLVVTNPFNSDGTFDYTNPIVPGTPRQFLDVKVVP